MKIIRSTLKLAACLLPGLLAVSAWAVTAKPESLSLAVDTSKTVVLSHLEGPVSVLNSNPGAVTVIRVDSKTYRVVGAALGSAVIQFKDRNRTSLVSVRVGAQAVATPTTPSAATAPLGGRLLASNCFQCHGTNGMGGFDRLAGKRSSEIYGELKEFATGAEDAGGIMAAHAMGFSDAQLRSIADYLSTVR